MIAIILSYYYDI